MSNDKRFIEETFPVKKVSIASAREKNIRHGHISTLHIWWARRPLASSRATAYAALIPPPENVEEWNKKRDFIAEFSKWENSLNQTMIQKAREEILKANGGKPPRVLDPFAGGGAIPLEALRLGCETYASDLNPVAVLIEKCTLEYPQKYGKKSPATQRVRTGPVNNKDDKVQGALFSPSETDEDVNPLVEDVKRWGQWVLEQARNEIGRFYPEDKDGSIPVGYIWARTIPCQNPSCSADIPLMRQYWLAKKAKKKVALFPYVEDGKVGFKVVGTDYDNMPAGFDPTKGTVSRAVATCLVCGATIDADTTRRLFQERKAGQRMVAVVLYKPGQTGKRYRIATAEDVKVFQEAEAHLEKKREQLMAEWGMDPVPDEPLPPKDSHRAVGSQLPLYNFKVWGDLFNSRQKLAMLTLVDKVRQIQLEMQNRGINREYIKTVASYLGLTVDMTGAFCNTLARWENTSEAIKHLYSRQALPMMWDYVESCPFSESTGSLEAGWEYYLKAIEHCSLSSENCGYIYNAPATQLEYEDNTFDAVFTDPPYYDNVPYSYLSDLFYVWLKRSLGHLFPELFSTPLSPKKNEIVVYANKPGIKKQATEFFEGMLKKSFQEIHRILKPGGVTIIVYAHKSTQGWETLINSLLDSGLVITAAWPINTEMRSRILARETAALGSSIYIVARKMKREQTGFYQEVRQAIEEHLNKKLERLWQEGIGGADFFISAIGSAIEVFGKYEKVMDYEGNIVRADRLLEDVRKIATEFAVRQILHNGFTGEISDLTRFYVLYRWNYGNAKVHFDEARKLAASCGIDIAREWNHGFIRKQKEFIRVLGPSERNASELKNPEELIDVLHAVLRYWEKGKRSEMVELLTTSGFGKSEAFYRVAQAISETLSDESKEKKLLDGFLAGRERLKDEITSPKQESFL